MSTALQSRETQSARGIEHIVQALNGLAFGTVEITIHHGRIVQIERREKLRIPEPLAGRGATSTDLG